MAKCNRVMKGYYALRWAVLERDNFTCQYCGQTAPDVKLEVDHIISVKDGGQDTIENLKTACYSCNIGRSALTIKNTHVKKQPVVKIPTRQDQIFAILKDYPQGLRANDIASKMDISKNVARCRLHFLRKHNKVVILSKGLYGVKSNTDISLGDTTYIPPLK
jgi:hypothetical protein